MLSLFKESMNKSKNSEEKSLLEKLNYCSCFTSKAQDDDHLPKYICMSCSILVENAYQLKVLCAKTEERYSEMIGRDCQMKGVKNIVHIKIEQNKTGSNNAKKNSRLEEEIMNMQIEIVDNENVGIANKPDDTQQEAQNMWVSFGFICALWHSFSFFFFLLNANFFLIPILFPALMILNRKERRIFQKLIRQMKIVVKIQSSLENINVISAQRFFHSNRAYVITCCTSTWVRQSGRNPIHALSVINGFELKMH